MKKTYTCVVCPNVCEIEAETNGTHVFSLSGNLCPRGAQYVKQEITDPRRTIATSVRVTGGDLPLASVRLTKPVPKRIISLVMREIRRVTLPAPVQAGTVIIKKVLGYDSDVIVTKSIARSDDS